MRARSYPLAWSLRPRERSIRVAARRAIPMLFAFCITVSTVLPARSAEYLTTDTIRELISGRPMTFFGTYSGIKFTGDAKWNKNGTIAGRTTILGITHEWKGRWHVRDNLYCRSLTSEGKSDSKCHRVQKVGPRTIRFIAPDGTVTSTTIVK